MPLLYKDFMNRSRQEHKQGIQNAHDLEDTVQQVVNFPNYRSERCYIYSNQKQDGLYSLANYENQNSIIKRGVSGIGVESINIQYCIPNVNTRNRLISFQYFNDLTVYTATLDITNYEDTTLLYTEIVAKMNAAAIPSPFTFLVNADCTVDLISSVNFKFVNCPFINFGESLTGLYYTSDYVPLMKSVPHLFYTSYIDFVVSEITNSQIAQSTYSEPQTFNTIQHIARVHVDDNIKIPRNVVKRYDAKINYFPFRHRSIRNISIQIVDEYNNTIASQVFNSASGETIELQHLKYTIVLNTVF
jgi:hypothetical protein